MHKNKVARMVDDSQSLGNHGQMQQVGIQIKLPEATLLSNFSET